MSGLDAVATIKCFASSVQRDVPRSRENEETRCIPLDWTHLKEIFMGSVLLREFDRIRNTK